MYFVGQRVVYVGCRCSLLHWIKRFLFPYESPKKGAIYTVSNIVTDDDDEQVALELVEFPSPACAPWHAGFWVRGFRPAVEKKTDISVFTEILNYATFWTELVE